MSATEHRIRWKGKTEGPLRREEIRRRLASGEFSRLHFIETPGGWKPLGEFLDEEITPAAKTGREPGVTPAEPPEPPGQGDDGQASARSLAFGYFLCGLCFAAPLAATVAAAFAARRTARSGDMMESRIQVALALAFTVLGIGFWLFALSR